MLHRRSALTTGAAALAAAGLGRIGAAQGDERPAAGPGAERRFEIRARIELAPSKGALRAFVPAQRFSAGWMPRAETHLAGDADRAERVRDPLDVVLAEWKCGAEAPTFEVASRFVTHDRAARVAYGLRITPSRFGRTSAFADHDRFVMSRGSLAEAWLDGTGWSSVDPARIGEAPSGLESGPFGLVVYPWAETVTGLIDCFDPHGFRFELTAREVTA